MAFPVVESVASGGGTDSSIGIPASMPFGITNGDLLLLFVSQDSGQVINIAGTTWTSIRAVLGGGGRAQVWGRISTGTDTPSITGDSMDYAYAVLRISGHGVTSLPTDVESNSATGTSNSPDPPNLAFSSSQDWLVLESFFADDDDDTATYWSTNYTGVAQQQSASSTSSCLLAVAKRNVTGSSEDPGTMHMNASEEWVAFTLAIPPAPSGPTEIFATLTGSFGSMSATTTATPNVQATLAASFGSLAATAVRPAPAVLSGAMGAMSGTATATPKVGATLAAPFGALTGTATAGRVVDAVLAAAFGALSGTATALPTVLATLSDSWALTGSATAGVSHSATLSAAWGLSGTTSATVTHPATLTGSWGALTAAATVQPPAVLTGALGALTGTLDATVETAGDVDAVLDGPFGALAGTATATPNVQATLSAPFGALTGTAIRPAPAVLAGAWGALSASSTATPVVGATLAGAMGALGATATATPTVLPTLSAPFGNLTGSMTASVSSETLPSIAQTDYTGIASGSTSKSLTSISWSEGDYIIVVGHNGAVSGTTLNAPTNANLSFDLITSVADGSGVGTFLYLAVAGSDKTGQTITMTATAGTFWGMSLWVVTGDPGGYLNVSANVVEDQITINPNDGSLVVFAYTDDQGLDSKNPATGTGTATERFNEVASFNVSTYGADWAGVSAGATDFGVSTYTNLTVAQVAIEIYKGSLKFVDSAAGAWGGMSGTATATPVVPATATGSYGTLAGALVASAFKLAQLEGAWGALTGTVAATPTVLPTATGAWGALTGTAHAAKQIDATGSATFELRRSEIVIYPGEHAATGRGLWGGLSTSLTAGVAHTALCVGRFAVDDMHMQGPGPRRRRGRPRTTLEVQTGKSIGHRRDPDHRTGLQRKTGV